MDAGRLTVGNGWIQTGTDAGERKYPDDSLAH